MGVAWWVVEFWAERYQTLAAGLLAVAIAWQQLRLLRRQTAIAENQEKIIMNQAAINKALDATTIRDFVSSTMAIHTMPSMVAREIGRDADGRDIMTWTDLSYRKGMMVPDIDAIRRAALSTFPEAAPQIMELAASMCELHDLVAEYDQAPWRNTDVAPAVGDRPEDLSDREFQMSATTSRVVTRFHRAVIACVVDLKLHQVG